MSYSLPVSIKNMIRFHDPEFQKSQKEIDALLEQNTSPEIKPSFMRVQEQFSLIAPNYSFRNSEFIAGFDNWHAAIKEEINMGNPVAIMTRQKHKSAIVRTILGYEENNEYYLLYDSQSNIIVAPPNIVFVGEYIPYKYSDAISDYYDTNSIRTFLTITK